MRALLDCRHSKVIMFHALALMVAVLLVSCGSTDIKNEMSRRIRQTADYDPSHFFLQKLESHRIVMIADTDHGSSIPMQGVVDFLDAWVDTLENPWVLPSIPRSLFLILEMDSLQAEKLGEYLETGDIRSVIHPALLHTTSYLEFYYDIRQLYQRIEEYNKKSSEGQRIVFRIFGPEKHIDLDNWTLEKRDSFFVYQRDEYSSSQVIHLLERHSDCRAVIFYGGTHLKRQRMLKKGANIEDFGYYMAHYLSEYFWDNVYTLHQSPCNSSHWLSDILSTPGITYAVDHSVFADLSIPGPAGSDPWDGYVVYCGSSASKKMLLYVWSSSLVDIVIDNLDYFPDMTNSFHRKYFLHMLEYLAAVAPERIIMTDLYDSAAVKNTISEWRSWHQTEDIDFVSDVTTLELWKRIINQIPNAEGMHVEWFETLVSRAAGFEAWHDDSKSPEARAEDYWVFIQNHRKPIVIENLVHMLWVGTNEEIEEAMAVLQAETGMTFKTAKEWTVWWRANRNEWSNDLFKSARGL